MFPTLVTTTGCVYRGGSAVPETTQSILTRAVCFLGTLHFCGYPGFRGVEWSGSNPRDCGASKSQRREAFASEADPHFVSHLQVLRHEAEGRTTLESRREHRREPPPSRTKPASEGGSPRRGDSPRDASLDINRDISEYDKFFTKSTETVNLRAETRLTASQSLSLVWIGDPPCVVHFWLAYCCSPPLFPSHKSGSKRSRIVRPTIFMSSLVT